MQKNIFVFSKFLGIFFFFFYLFSLGLIFSVAFDQKKYATSCFHRIEKLFEAEIKSGYNIQDPNLISTFSIPSPNQTHPEF